MVAVNMREMLEAGVHFGHQVRKWNPKMKPYIYGKKNGIYIINLQTSIELFKTALEFVTEVVASGKDALIVGTKKQAQAIISEISETCSMHYVNKRWLGGLLTNFPIVKKSIERLLDLDEMKRDGRWEVKPKKEQSRLEKRYKKLHKNLWGVRNIKELPGVLIVIDSCFEEIAVEEAKKLGIPIVGIVDTNADPEGISYPVPGNDDAIRSIKLFTTKFGEAVKLGLEKRISESINQEKAAAEADAEVEAEVEAEPEAKAAKTETREKHENPPKSEPHSTVTKPEAKKETGKIQVQDVGKSKYDYDVLPEKTGELDEEEILEEDNR
ncbi:MAG: 30S ribosomal protein S2 [Candidatus Aminicenantes bacterium]|nr:30S ribosomal protein S2 [Candidatus Aminicenantes bacterium]NIM85160.1 30S ribosomal protein S2 [Candidatus Aminicenantes bacterium]NIN24672.1 30S ribosomal protein S2 [Candidatus Aminicenantes bacterium]NIN48433.1 30S ribosomal protein S2 [Candidatus Aminicenantes bacterium]NIN87663.1 30S ribosomal protein S2 [Candidatus Aminicenantes bacterium]